MAPVRARRPGLSTRAIHAGQRARPARPARSRCRSTRPRPTPRRGSASTRATSTRARTTPRARRSSATWPRSRAARTASPSARGWRRIDDAAAACSRPATTSCASNNMYGGTFRLFEQVFAELGLQLHLRGLGRPRPRSRRRSRRRRKLIYVETPTNPLMTITDLAAHRARSRSARGAPQRGATTRSPRPYFQRPLELGVDIVAPLDDQVPERPQRHGRRRAGRHARRPGASGCASCRTRSARCRARWTAGSRCAASRRWPLRMERHDANARAAGRVAGDASREVRALFYPGLPDPPAARAGEAPDDRLRRDDLVRARRASTPASDSASAAAVHARRDPGRRREPGLPPGLA